MDAFTPNPQADADAGFDVAKPGIYRMRIEGSANFPAVQDFTSKAGNRCLKVRCVFAEPTAVYTLEDKPAKNLGSIVDSSCVLEPAEKQGKTRSLVEACGISWLSFTDIQMLNGKELSVKVGIEEYNGEKRNKIERFLKAGV